ncbi:hypothetical protein BDV28DRAFT_59673 [Aspergillus coremiiformis]|uniref:Uncharacterized protein n=1 Tax=Aspergillus coremiiformis TaxID=138285 RepID=A0A5N6YVH6_9EURO|nr:hypothetical protein BDV28DRAFT_59673 [Aspergillus coremiiformis]
MIEGTCIMKVTRQQAATGSPANLRYVCMYTTPYGVHTVWLFQVDASAESIRNTCRRDPSCTPPVHCPLCSGITRRASLSKNNPSITKYPNDFRVLRLTVSIQKKKKRHLISSARRTKVVEDVTLTIMSKKKNKVVLGIEPGLPESESDVLTITLHNRLLNE